MYITCSKCSTNFFIPSEKALSPGRKVRCSKCGHVWHYDVEQAEEDISKNPKSDDYANPVEVNKFQSTGPRSDHGPTNPNLHLPVLIPVESSQNSYLFSITLGVITILLSFILFYEHLGIKPFNFERPLRIKDVIVSKALDSNVLVIKYALENSSDKPASRPLVRIRLFDNQNKLIKTHIDNNIQSKLAPKECTLITTEIDSLPNITDRIDVTVGNRLDFILR